MTNSSLINFMNSVLPTNHLPGHGKNVPSEPPIWLGPTQVINFVVAMAGEAYNAHKQEVQNGNSGLYARRLSVPSNPSASNPEIE